MGTKKRTKYRPLEETSKSQTHHKRNKFEVNEDSLNEKKKSNVVHEHQDLDDKKEAQNEKTDVVLPEYTNKNEEAFKVRNESFNSSKNQTINNKKSSSNLENNDSSEDRKNKCKELDTLDLTSKGNEETSEEVVKSSGLKSNRKNKNKKSSSGVQSNDISKDTQNKYEERGTCESSFEGNGKTSEANKKSTDLNVNQKTKNIKDMCIKSNSISIDTQNDWEDSSSTSEWSPKGNGKASEANKKFTDLSVNQKTKNIKDMCIKSNSISIDTQNDWEDSSSTSEWSPKDNGKASEAKKKSTDSSMNKKTEDLKELYVQSNSISKDTQNEWENSSVSESSPNVDEMVSEAKNTFSGSNKNPKTKNKKKSSCVKSNDISKGAQNEWNTSQSSSTSNESEVKLKESESSLNKKTKNKSSSNLPSNHNSDTELDVEQCIRNQEQHNKKNNKKGKNQKFGSFQGGNRDDHFNKNNGKLNRQYTSTHFNEDRSQSFTIDNKDFLKEIDKDLFELSKDYCLAHCVAKDLRMGAGIAVDFKYKFGGVGKLVDQKLNIGDVGEIKCHEQYVFYLITKKMSNGKPNMVTMEKALRSLLRKMKELNLTKLGIPKIGCGLDGLDWSNVKSLMMNIFDESGIQITVCLPSKILDRKAASPPQVMVTPKNLWEMENETDIIVFVDLEQVQKNNWEDIVNKVNKVNDRHPFIEKLMEDVQTKQLNHGDTTNYRVNQNTINCVFVEQNSYYSDVENGFISIGHSMKNKDYKYMAIQSCPMELDVFNRSYFIVLILRSIKNLKNKCELWLCTGDTCLSPGNSVEQSEPYDQYFKTRRNSINYSSTYNSNNQVDHKNYKMHNRRDQNVNYSRFQGTGLSPGTSVEQTEPYDQCCKTKRNSTNYSSNSNSNNQVDSKNYKTYNRSDQNLNYS